MWQCPFHPPICHHTLYWLHVTRGVQNPLVSWCSQNQQTVHPNVQPCLSIHEVLTVKNYLENIWEITQIKDIMKFNGSWQKCTGDLTITEDKKLTNYKIKHYIPSDGGLMLQSQSYPHIFVPAHWTHHWRCVQSRCCGRLCWGQPYQGNWQQTQRNVAAIVGWW